MKLELKESKVLRRTLGSIREEEDTYRIRHSTITRKSLSRP